MDNDSSYSSDSSLVDYFFTIGLSVKEYANQRSKVFMQEEIEPSMISQYPSTSKNHISLEDNIKAIKTTAKTIKNLEYSFILDNNCFSSMFPRKYVHCIVIYENTKKFDECLDKLDCPTVTVSSTSNFFVPKAICCAGVEPYLNQFSKILNYLVEYAGQSRMLCPIEQIVQSVARRLPKPPRGIYQVSASIYDFTFKISNNGLNQLPSCHFPLHLVYCYFTIEQSISIFKHVLLENKVIFFSERIELLTPIILFFISQLFPFKYPHPVISILPEQLSFILATVTPYVVGINKKFDRSFEKTEHLEGQNCLLVDIDLALIYEKDCEKDEMDSEQYKKYFVEEYPSLPEHYNSKLFNKLYKLLSSQELDKIKGVSYQLNYDIHDLFFQFLVNIMQSYRDYINFDFFMENDISLPCIEFIYKIEAFLKNFKSNDLPFYTKFMKDGQLFCDYIYRCIIPKTIEEKLEMLCFDENLKLKNNRKFFSFTESTPFLTSKLYKHQEIYQWTFKPRKVKNKNNVWLGKEEVEGKIKYLVFPEFDSSLFDLEEEKKKAKDLTKHLKTINWEIAANLTEEKQTLTIEKVMKTSIYQAWLLLYSTVLPDIPLAESIHWFEMMEKIFTSIQLHEVELVNTLFSAVAEHSSQWQALVLYDHIVNGRMLTFSVFSITANILQDKSRKESKSLTDSTRLSSSEISLPLAERLFSDRKENVSFQQNFSCPNCGRNFKMSKIYPYFYNCKKEGNWFQCSYCLKYFSPLIKFVIFGGSENNSDIDNTRQLSLLSPYETGYNLVSEVKTHCKTKKFHELEEISPSVFWNILFYFTMFELPFELFLRIK